VRARASSFIRRTLAPALVSKGLDPAARLNYLSTFLGQINPHSTVVYLTITGELLAAANARFETYATPLFRKTQP
jgi:hypothetical protein